MHRNFYATGILLATLLPVAIVNAGTPDNWTKIKGEWQMEKGQIEVDASEEQAMLLQGDANQQNYMVEAEVSFEKVVKSDCWLSLVFRATADGSLASHVFVKPKASNKRGCGFMVGTPNHWSERKTAKVASDFEMGVPRHLKIVVQGETVTAYLDGDQLFSSPYCVDAPTGLVGLGAYGCKARFDHFSVTPLPDTEPFQPLKNPDYLIIAHRGFSAKFPENTIASIKGGIAAGANGIEFDIYRCASGEIVLMHDATVDRTTDGTGRVDELRLSELRKLDAGSWKDKRFTGEPVPTLDEVLAVFEDTAATAVIEVKAMDVDAKELARVVSSHQAKACVISFKQDKLAQIKQVDARIRCGLLLSRIPAGKPPAEWMLEQTRKLGCEVLSANYKLLSPETIGFLRKNGIEVWAWTVNDLAVMRALVDWGIDGITTDVPDAQP